MAKAKTKSPEVKATKSPEAKATKPATKAKATKAKAKPTGPSRAERAKLNRERTIAERAKGKTHREVAEAVGITHQRVASILADADVDHVVIHPGANGSVTVEGAPKLIEKALKSFGLKVSKPKRTKAAS